MTSEPPPIEPTRLESVNVVYRSAGEQVRAVTDVTWGFPSGSISVLAGPSGSGKSTLLRVLAGFDRPTTGAVFVGGQEISAMSERRRRALRRTTVAVIHQRPLANLLDELTATQHIGFARAVRRVGRQGDDALNRFGLAGHHRARPGHLSGGEQQRLALAMVLAGATGVVLADEPTAELDRANATRVIDALHQLAGSGRTVIVASHDPEMIGAADHVARLSDGRIVE